MSLEIQSVITAALQEVHKKSGGHNGISFTQLRKMAPNFKKSEVADALNLMKKEGKIKVRKGIHTRLIFLNK